MLARAGRRLLQQARQMSSMPEKGGSRPHETESCQQLLRDHWALANAVCSQCALLPTPAAIHDTAFGEFLPLSDRAGVPVLVRLRERQWGALARLPHSKLVEAGYTGVDAQEGCRESSDAWSRSL